MRRGRPPPRARQARRPRRSDSTGRGEASPPALRSLAALHYPRPVTLVGLLLLLLVAGLCGSIGRAIAGYSHTGCLASIALGFIGALLGMWLARALHLPELFSLHVAGERFPVVWSIIGSTLFVAVLGLFSRSRS